MNADPIRIAGTEDRYAVGDLLDAFNREFDEPTPGPEKLSERIAELLAGGDTTVLLAGEAPDGLAVMRFRKSIWTAGLECYLAELYVEPGMRGNGLGRRLMERAIEIARERGADYMELGTGEDDVAARSLYESLGFVNREKPPDGPVMYVYELDLNRT